MSKIASLVKYLNDYWSENALVDARFKGASLLGIAVQTPRKYDGDVSDVQLSITGDEGEVIVDSVAYDSVNPLMIYHRIMGSTYLLNQRDSGFGGNISYTRKLDMSAMVYIDKSRIKLAAEDMDLLLHIKFPQQIAGASLPDGFATCHFTPIGTEFNQVYLLDRELKIKDYSMGPEVVLFELKYSIECSYQLDCIKVLCCP